MLGRVEDDASAASSVGQDGNGSALYFAVDDAAELYSRANVGGGGDRGRIDPRDYGSREFICRDPGGYARCFAT